MQRAANWTLAGLLILAIVASACMTPPNPSNGAASVGGSAAGDPSSIASSTYTPPSTVHPEPLKDGKVDQAQSQALTDYLKAHRLPLVGAQVLAAPDGRRQVILFGYVATDYGKGDAEAKTRRYIKDPQVTVDNRIKVEPTIANLKDEDSPDSARAQADIQAYENQRYEEQLQQQQLYRYQNPSPMTMVIPFLGFFGGSFGGGSFGFGGGGIGPGMGGGYYPPPSYRTYPSYPAYPSYPTYP
jgi:hypothetical protein